MVNAIVAARNFYANKARKVTVIRGIMMPSLLRDLSTAPVCITFWTVTRSALVNSMLRVIHSLKISVSNAI